MKYRYSPPEIIRRFYRNSVWNSKVNKILLTFDDGPNILTTEKILKVLSTNSIQAVFFCVGNNVERLPALTKSILSEGHLLGNHTYNHSKILKFNNQKLKGDISKFNNKIEQILGFTPNLFRPPYGRIYPRHVKVLMRENLTNVMWSLLTYDYKNDINIVKFALNNYLRGDSIVVFHDSIKSSNIIIDSINLLLEIADKNEFKFGTPAECLN